MLFGGSLPGKMMGGICDEATLGPIVTKLTEPLEEQPRGSSERLPGATVGRWMFHPFLHGIFG